MKESSINLEEILAEVESLKSNKWITTKKSLPPEAEIVIWECFKDIGKPGKKWVSYKQAVKLLKKRFNVSIAESTLRRLYTEEIKPKFEKTNGKTD